MTSRLSMITFSRGRLVRSVAILFLLYTGLDIACPQICSEEVVGFAANEVSLSQPDNEAKSTFSAQPSLDRQDSQRDGPTNQRSQDEDCFCCCAHVLPGIVYVAPTLLDLKSPVSIPDLVSAPAPPLFRTFPPPRFA